jgi:hypothetical protein
MIRTPTYRFKYKAPNEKNAVARIIFHKLYGRKVRVRGRLTPKQREAMFRGEKKHVKIHRKGCCGTYGLLSVRHYCYNDFKLSDVTLLRKLGVRGPIRFDIYVY